MKIYSQLESAQIENVVADPTPTAQTVGRVIYRTDTDEYKVCDATPAWRTIVSSLDGTLTFTGFAATPTVNPVAGSYKIYFKTDGKAYYLDSSGAEQPLGSGSGSGGYNYIDNGQAEANTNGWTLYANTVAGLRPDNFGGTPTGLTFVRDAATPLISNASFRFSKDAVNRQGSGVYYSFNNQTGHATLKMLFSMVADLSDANLADADLAVYLVGSNDNFTANFQVIEPNNPDILAGVKQVFKQIQFLSGNLSYRLCIHVKSVSALAYTVLFDEVELGPKSASTSFYGKDTESTGAINILGSVTSPSKGTVITDISDITRRGNVALITMSYVQVGGAGASGSGDYLFELPNSLKMDTSFIDAGSNRTLRGLAIAGQGANVTDSTARTGYVSYYDQSHVKIQIRDEANDVFKTVGSTWFSLGNANQSYLLQFEAPIQGWSSNARTSEDFGGREIVVRAAGNSSSLLTANVTDIDFTLVEETTSSWSGTQFTAPETGCYLVSGCVFTAATTTSRTESYVNGVKSKLIGEPDSNSTLIKIGCIEKLNKGDTLSFRQSGSLTLSSSINFHWLSINKLSSPQAILETETVNFRAECSSGQTIPHGTETTIVFNDVKFDSHGSYNQANGQYICAQTGKLQVNGGTWFLAGVFGTCYMTLAKNGINVTTGHVNNSSSDRLSAPLSDIVDVNKGDILEMKVLIASNTSSAEPLETVASLVNGNFFSLTKV